ncbi:unnamed protein product [Hymenolepis diminuta]|uniref:Uncharacterized protein n=1 Tax=Hymenolepis diminuta TaxID=6216 RepID=A0A564ZAP5_HYMDI|nr:unnamed protein product [Hymenolepis diminuta]
MGISESHHDPNMDHTYNNCFDKGKDMFRKGLANHTEKERVMQLLRRFGTAKHRKVKRHSFKRTE